MFLATGAVQRPYLPKVPEMPSPHDGGKAGQ
jgi:hypothetical protein